PIGNNFRDSIRPIAAKRLIGRKLYNTRGWHFIDFESSAFNRTQPPFHLLFKRFCGLCHLWRNRRGAPSVPSHKRTASTFHQPKSKSKLPHLLKCLMKRRLLEVKQSD